MNTLGSRTLTSLDDARAILDSKPPFYIRAPQAPGVRQILPDAKVLRIQNMETRKEGGRGSRGGSSAAGKTFILWCELMKQLPQCCTRVLKRVRVAIPIAPAPRNRKN